MLVLITAQKHYRAGIRYPDIQYHFLSLAISYDGSRQARRHGELLVRHHADADEDELLPGGAKLPEPPAPPRGGAGRSVARALVGVLVLVLVIVLGRCRRPIAPFPPPIASPMSFQSVGLGIGIGIAVAIGFLFDHRHKKPIPMPNLIPNLTQDLIPDLIIDLILDLIIDLIRYLIIDLIPDLIIDLIGDFMTNRDHDDIIQGN